MRAAPQLTYPELGATRSVLPAGYRHLERQRVIGHGPDDFGVAAEAVMHWGVQRGAGLALQTEAGRATAGVRLVVRIGRRPLWVAAPCAVVYTVEEPRRRGFAYGTLEGHPVSGEELFLVERRPDDAVVLTVRSFSRPALWWVRLAAPGVRVVQRLLAAQYLRALDR